MWWSTVMVTETNGFCIGIFCFHCHGPLTKYAKLRVAHAPETPGTFFPPELVSDPVMHHGTCVTHVPWCMLGSLTSGFLLIRQREKRSRHSRCICNPQFCVSGKRPIAFGRWHSVGRGIKICLDWVRKLMMKPNHRRIQDVTVFQANKFAKQVFQLTLIPIRIILLSLVSIQWSFPWENTTSRAEPHGSQGEDIWEWLILYLVSMVQMNNRPWSIIHLYHWNQIQN